MSAITAELRTIAEALNYSYGHLSPQEYTGPPTSIVASLNRVANSIEEKEQISPAYHVYGELLRKFVAQLRDGTRYTCPCECHATEHHDSPQQTGLFT